MERHADDRRFLVEVTPRPIVVVVQGQAKVAVHAKANRRTLVDLVTDEQTGTGQVLQGVAAFVAVELVATVAGKTHVAEDDLRIGADLGALQLDDTCGVAHQYTRVGCQRGCTGVGKAIAFLPGLVDQNPAGQGFTAQYPQAERQTGKAQTMVEITRG
ncbi:hypothetical protein D3C77_396250 [compost metagenome]